MRLYNLGLVGILPLLLSGCLFTEYKTIETPIYIDRELPVLKVYDVNSSYTFKGLIKEGIYIKVPEPQFREYIEIKKTLEVNLAKSNSQVDLYNEMAKKPIIPK